MKRIPLFVVEEHMEAFFIWNYARSKQWIASANNTLLHVDEHSDMDTPVLRASVNAINGNLQKLYNFTYNELGIGNFILPTIYQGLFDKAYWIRRKHSKYQPAHEKIVIYSYNQNGKLFFLAHSGIDISTKPDAKCASHYLNTIADEFPKSDLVVLDIDLDYFSSSISIMNNSKIEITRDEYESYRKNKYHFLRISGAFKTKVTDENGRYYVHYDYKPEPIPEQATATEAQILKRINGFAEFLKKNAIRPQIIDICRSRFSGYTPEHQWQFIEKNLINKLGTLYELEVSHIDDIIAREGLT